MPSQSLTYFQNGTRIRHEAYIRKRIINTLYGVIQNGLIETDGLKKGHTVFKHPLDFIVEHKNEQIRNKHHKSVMGNPWKIVEYWDDGQKVWRSLRDYKVIQVNCDSISTITNTSSIIQTIYSNCDSDNTNLVGCDDSECESDSEDDDYKSFVSCRSCISIYKEDLSYEPFDELLDDSHGPYQVTWNHVDNIEVWQCSLWVKKDYLDAFHEYLELLLDEDRFEQIENELSYELLDREYPWITRHNLPHEEELWIALRTTVPQFGEVWMDAYGRCWEIKDTNAYMANIGNWIGQWSWTTKMMNLGVKEPSQLIDCDEFWDILQDFDES